MSDAWFVSVLPNSAIALRHSSNEDHNAYLKERGFLEVRHAVQWASRMDRDIPILNDDYNNVWLTDAIDKAVDELDAEFQAKQKAKSELVEVGPRLKRPLTQLYSVVGEHPRGKWGVSIREGLVPERVVPLELRDKQFESILDAVRYLKGEYPELGIYAMNPFDTILTNGLYDALKTHEKESGMTEKDAALLKKRRAQAAKKAFYADTDRSQSRWGRVIDAVMKIQ